ncbi:MAG: two-component regulator propeller domain-containing protein [Thermonemataceae bacterium]|nr:two-component regulator propeller domain-containing protein [Thermonemataceae bacterium]
MKKVGYLLVLIFWANFLFAQTNIPLGAWRTHLPYRSVKSLSSTPNQVYAVAESGIFVFDKTENTLTILGKTQGLSEAQASQIAYSADYEMLIIAYANGNIDIKKGNEITNIVDVKNLTTVSGSKAASQILLQGQNAYIATDFGVVVVDLSKKEIKEVWQNLGLSGTPLAVTGITFTNNTFYLATPNGLLYAPNNLNLQDFHSWQKYETPSLLPQTAVQKVVFANANLYASLNGQGIYKLPNLSGTWQKLNGITENNFNNLQSFNNQVFILSGAKVIVLDANEQMSFWEDSRFTNLQAIWLENGLRWVADAKNGLLSDFEGSWKSYTPNGTFSLRTWKTLYFADKMLAISGGFDENYIATLNTQGFDIFENGFWRSFNSSALENTENAPFAYDLSAASYNASQKILSLASFGNGIIQQNTSDGTFKIIDETTAQTPFYTQTDVKISDLKNDRQGNLWVTQFQASPSLHQQKPDGSWISYNYITQTQYPLEILIDNNDYKWIRLAPESFAGGIWVCDTQGNQNKHLTANNAKLTNPNILSMAIDRNGVIWLGSETGVMTVLNSYDVFSPNFQVTFPIFDKRQLLESISVTAIAIDGANRKWFGTKDKGIFLFDENTEELIANYTTENSPLISNQIKHLSIHAKTGEVFISTEQGICSFRDGVSVAAENFGNVKVFPNPVKPDFNGLIGIEGLTDNAEVKITDIAGKLMYQTIAKGGTATWNGRNYQGKKAKTGVYLIFSANANGEEWQVAKIAIL